MGLGITADIIIMTDIMTELCCALGGSCGMGLGAGAWGLIISGWEDNCRLGLGITCCAGLTIMTGPCCAMGGSWRRVLIICSLEDNYWLGLGLGIMADTCCAG